MSKKDRTPYEVTAYADEDATVVLTVRARRSDLHFNGLSAVSVASNQIVSAEVIRPLRVGDRIAHKERPEMSRESRLVRGTIVIDGVLFVGFCSFRASEDRFDPTNLEHARLVFAPADLYERVEE